MNVLILQGSPNREGSTAILCEEFACGARQAGHTVERIDVARADVRPCTGCVACGYGARPCVQRDGMAAILKKILATDVLVLEQKRAPTLAAGARFLFPIELD